MGNLTPRLVHDQPFHGFEDHGRGVVSKKRQDLGGNDTKCAFLAFSEKTTVTKFVFDQSLPMAQSVSIRNVNTKPTVYMREKVSGKPLAARRRRDMTALLDREATAILTQRDIRFAKRAYETKQLQEADQRFLELELEKDRTRASESSETLSQAPTRPVNGASPAVIAPKLTAAAMVAQMPCARPQSVSIARALSITSTQPQANAIACGCGHAGNSSRARIHAQAHSSMPVSPRQAGGCFKRHQTGSGIDAGMCWFVLPKKKDGVERDHNHTHNPGKMPRSAPWCERSPPVFGSELWAAGTARASARSHAHAHSPAQARVHVNEP
jgi:hypothetical protein